jgi:putative spermidine/putrescine transport system ATP-binding protein
MGAAHRDHLGGPFPVTTHAKEDRGSVNKEQNGPLMRAASLGSHYQGAQVNLDRLVRVFGQTRALDGFSISIEPGEFVALLGPSGCGKTTALRVLAGFERLDGGRVFVDGQDLARVNAQSRDMGMVFQSYSLFPNMNALNNVAYGLRMRGQRSQVRKKKAAEVLGLVGLADQATKYPHQMSGGQQQRIALARALAIEPRVLLLDEPLSALDAKVRADLRDQIRSLQQRLSITTVFVTHDQEEALSMADRVCVMSKGRNEQTATPAVLYARPATPFVAEFVGVSSRVPVETDSNQVVVFGQTCPVRGVDAFGVMDSVDALLRPEDIAIEVDAAGKGFVTHRSFLGATTRLVVQVGEIPVRVDVRSETAADIELGTHVSVNVISRDVLVAPRLRAKVSVSA